MAASGRDVWRGNSCAYCSTQSLAGHDRGTADQFVGKPRRYGLRNCQDEKEGILEVRTNRQESICQPHLPGKWNCDRLEILSFNACDRKVVHDAELGDPWKTL